MARIILENRFTARCCNCSLLFPLRNRSARRLRRPHQLLEVGIVGKVLKRGKVLDLSRRVAGLHGPGQPFQSQTSFAELIVDLRSAIEQFPLAVSVLQRFSEKKQRLFCVPHMA